MRLKIGVGHLLFSLSLASVLSVGAILYWGRVALKQELPDVSKLKRAYPVVQYLGPQKKGAPPTPEFSIRFSDSRPAGWKSLDQISRPAIGAIVVSEDWAFYNHKGYDADQIREAIKEDLAEGSFARGASTITQQVVKNVFLSSEKSIWRKIKELFLAVEIEKTVGKRKILETYLNIAEFGAGIYGIGPASRHYFHKESSELEPNEGAFLAMLLPSPKRYSQSFRNKRLTHYARKTVDRILGKMVQARYITEEQLTQFKGSPLKFEDQANPEASEKDETTDAQNEAPAPASLTSESTNVQTQ